MPVFRQHGRRICKILGWMLSPTSSAAQMKVKAAGLGRSNLQNMKIEEISLGS